MVKKLEHYSQFQPSSLTIQQYLDFGRSGTAKSSYLFLRNELLVRLANIMQVPAKQKCKFSSWEV